MDSQSDEILIIRYSKGDFKSFDTLYNRYSVYIYNYLLKKLNKNPAVNDICQAVWEKVIEKADEFRLKIESDAAPFRFKPYFFNSWFRTRKE